ncbi:TPMT family [Trinorchestia longiramus]|nr:TPMT family [Trinorchestia longiramus]
MKDVVKLEVKKSNDSWHVSEYHPCLIKYANELLSGPDKRVFVPLCGKTLDLIWLYKAGHRVVGLEGVERVVVEYGEEHKLNFQQVSTSYGKVYQTQDGRLQVINTYQCCYCSTYHPRSPQYDSQQLAALQS